MSRQQAEELTREAGLKARAAFEAHDPEAWSLARAEIARRKMLESTSGRRP